MAPISAQVRLVAVGSTIKTNVGGRPEDAFDVSAADAVARKQGLLAIVFTDIVDSTPLIRRLGDPSYVELLSRHTTAVTEIVQRHGGSIANTTGDGFFLAFGSSIDAADACFDILDSAKLLEFQMRIGMHIGEPLPTSDTNYIGVSANETARLMGKAEPNRIVVSDAARRVLQGTPRLVFHSLGRVSLKGFDEDNEVYEVWRLDEPTPSS